MKREGILLGHLVGVWGETWESRTIRGDERLRNGRNCGHLPSRSPGTAINIVIVWQRNKEKRTG